MRTSKIPTFAFTQDMRTAMSGSFAYHCDTRRKQQPQMPSMELN